MECDANCVVSHVLDYGHEKQGGEERVMIAGVCAPAADCMPHSEGMPSDNHPDVGDEWSLHNPNLLDEVQTHLDSQYHNDCACTQLSAAIQKKITPNE